MKASIIMCFALVVLSLIVMILSGTMGTHESVYSLPDGNTLTIERVDMPDVHLNGQLLEPKVTNDYELVFCSSLASALIFALAVIPISYCEDKAKSKRENQ